MGRRLSETPRKGFESVNLSPRYDKVTCLTHGNGVRRRGGWGVERRGWELGEAKRPGEGRV